MYPGLEPYLPNTICAVTVKVDNIVTNNVCMPVVKEAKAHDDKTAASQIPYARVTGGTVEKVERKGQTPGLKRNRCLC